jgi:hypothetical protein
MPKTYRDVNYSLLHSLQRFKERYKNDLSISQYNDLIKYIQKLIDENSNIQSKK